MSDLTNPLCVPESLGSLLHGQFANNSRVGPFEKGDHVIAGIFRSPTDNKRLLANYSTDNGLTWSAVSTAALTNTIVAFDCYQTPAAAAIHVATQESTTGRVAHFVFDLTTGTWTTESETVLASATIITGQVTPVVLSPSGDIVIAYETNKESVSAAYRTRLAFKRSISGVWSSEVALGHVGEARSDSLGSWVVGQNNRATLIALTTSSPNPANWMQVLQAAGTLSSAFYFRTHGLLGNSPSFSTGDPTTYFDGSNYILAVPVIFGGGSFVFSFIDSDTPALAQSELGLDNLTANSGARAAVSLRYARDELHSIDWGWPDLGSPTWLRHKVKSGVTFSSLMTDQCGPQMGAISSTTQSMGATIAARTCNDVESLYALTFVAIGTVDGVADTVKFEWLKLDTLPTAETVTLTTWLAGLSAQTIDFCCDGRAAEACRCTTSKGIIYEMSQEFPDDDGCEKVWLRRSPHISDEQKRIFHNELQVLTEHGTAPTGTNPQLMLRWSNDYGKIWSNEHWKSAGKTGEYRKRSKWTQLGSAFNRIYELRGSGKTSIIDAYLKATE